MNERAPTLNDMATWTDRLGHSRLRTFTDKEGRFWIEQNSSKNSRWGKLAREGHDIAWEFERPGGSYTGRILVDGEICSPSEATSKVLK
jgi:hypothetical protein